jgi:hypothetical protein
MKLVTSKRISQALQFKREAKQPEQRYNEKQARRANSKVSALWSSSGKCLKKTTANKRFGKSLQSGDD